MAIEKEKEKQRRAESKKIRILLDTSIPEKNEKFELDEIEPRFAKYVSIRDDYSVIEQFICPVEGCGYQTDQGPGALRMHMLNAADPKIKGRYNPQHETFMKDNPDEMTIEGVRYLSQFQSSIHLDTSIKHIKE